MDVEFPLRLLSDHSPPRWSKGVCCARGLFLRDGSRRGAFSETRPRGAHSVGLKGLMAAEQAGPGEGYGGWSPASLGCCEELAP